MEAAQQKHCLVVLLLMAITSVVLAFSPVGRVSNEIDINLDLPQMVGSYTGIDIKFCQNQVCLREFPVSDLNGADVCVSCGSSLDVVSLAEKRFLAKGTIFVKKKYVNAAGEVVFVSIVLSGREQRGIHRPEECIPAQGYVIESSSVIAVPILGREPLDVRLLELRRDVARADGLRVRSLSSYVYWFTAKDRETCDHYERLFWMASNRLFENMADRWAYVAVSTVRDASSDDHVERLKAFIADLYPMIVKKADGERL